MRAAECGPLWLAAKAVHDTADVDRRPAPFGPGGEGTLALELAQLLIEKGADVNAVGADANGNESTPLWWAAKKTNCGRNSVLQLAMLLIEKGADVDAVGADKDGNKSTPLWWAARQLYQIGAPLATLLLDKGADVNAVGATVGSGTPSNQECTPLWWAAQGRAYTRDSCTFQHT